MKKRTILNKALLIALLSILAIRPVWAQVRIMPLGNSITQGVMRETADQVRIVNQLKNQPATLQSSGFNGKNRNWLEGAPAVGFGGVLAAGNGGYRLKLAQMLFETGWDVEFVGQRTEGGGNHEGYPGIMTVELMELLPDILSANQPDVILFHIGTNDLPEPIDAEGSYENIREMLEMIHQFNPAIRVVLARIIPCLQNTTLGVERYPAIIELNKLLLEIPSQYSFVELVDMWTPFSSTANWETALMSDSWHPNEDGYRLMAEVWRDGLTQIIPGQAPVISGLTPNSGNIEETGFSCILEGDYLMDGATVILQHDFYPPLEAVSVAFINTHTLHAQFDLSQGAAGEWRMQVINPNKMRNIFSDNLSFIISGESSPFSGIVRINAGGELYTDTEGNEWIADQPYGPNTCGYEEGGLYSTADPIGNTENDALYQTERWGMTAYRFDVPNGDYEVTLHFAEIFLTEDRGRQINVAIEDQAVLEKLDIHREVGHDQALVYTYPDVSVEDGRLDITFSANRESPKISAIEVKAVRIIPKPVLSIDSPALAFGSSETIRTLEVQNTGNAPLNWSLTENPEQDWIVSIDPVSGTILSGGSQTVTVRIDRNGLAGGEYSGILSIISNGGDQDIPVSCMVAGDVLEVQPIRLNAGGAGYSDVDNNVWSADQPYTEGGYGYVGGDIYETIDPISGTGDDLLYQSERWGMSAYQFDLDNGDYEVILHFAEIFVEHHGERKFNVFIEDQIVLSELDIYRQVGHDAALSFTFSDISLNDGRLDISFEKDREYPKISAIEVIPVLPSMPQLAVTPLSLDFGATQTELPITITNSGGYTLDWSISLSTQVDWITSISTENGSLDQNNSAQVLINVNRANLTEGDYQAILVITSNGGSQNINVNLYVPGAPEFVVSSQEVDWGTVETSAELTLQNNGDGTITWSAVPGENTDWISSVTPEAGSLESGNPETVTILIDRANLDAGEYNGELIFSTNIGEYTIALHATVQSASEYVIRVNAGAAEEYVDSNGMEWLADQSYTPGGFGYVDNNGGAFVSVDPVSNTDEDELFQTERWGMSAYQFDVPAGNYEVILHFAETYLDRSRRRIFNVAIEGEEVLTELDLYRRVGHDVAVSYTFSNIVVMDNRLDVTFEDIKERSCIKAIEIMAVPISKGRPEMDNFATVELPTEFMLHQNYPNPFNSSTTIQFDLPFDATVSLKIFNVLGQEVFTENNMSKAAGQSFVNWHGIDNSGMIVASGIYFYQINVIPVSPEKPRITQLRKMYLAQ